MICGNEIKPPHLGVNVFRGYLFYNPTAIYSMTLKERYLLLLIRAGINTDISAEDTPPAVPPAWQAIYALAVQQGVLDVAWDGLQSICRGNERLAAENIPHDDSQRICAEPVISYSTAPSLRRYRYLTLWQAAAGR